MSRYNYGQASRFKRTTNTNSRNSNQTSSSSNGHPNSWSNSTNSKNRDITPRRKKEFWDDHSDSSDSEADDAISALREFSTSTIDSHPRRKRHNNKPTKQQEISTFPDNDNSALLTIEEDDDIGIDEMTQLLPYDGGDSVSSSTSTLRKPNLKSHLKKRSPRDDGVDRAKESRQTGTHLTQTHEMLQKQHEDEQDDIIEDMSTVVNRLTEMSRNIGDEITDHRELLNDLTVDVGDSQSHLDRVHDKLELIIGETGRGHYCIIAVLTCVLVLLLWAIFS